MGSPWSSCPTVTQASEVLPRVPATPTAPLPDAGPLRIVTSEHVAEGEAFLIAYDPAAIERGEDPFAGSARILGLTDPKDATT